VIFTELELPGAFLLRWERREDERGFFARTWCEEEAVAHGLNPHVAQANVSFNAAAGTVRGMHYQVAPHAEAKLVRCTIGSIHDVIVDLRPDSPTRGQHCAVRLTSSNHASLYIPEGLAHGFQTLEPNTEVSYQMSAPYAPASARGIRWDDPLFAIRWPLPVTVISDRDRTYPNFVWPQEAGHPAPRLR
jgi:dTDP-4-dehydrorhamnose 3,5-epimerase